MPVLHTDGSQLEGLIEASGQVPLLLYFTAAWCAPCRVLSPIVDRLAEEAKGRLTVAKIDADVSADAAKRLQVRGLPTLVLFKDGLEKARHVGMGTREQLLSWLAHGGASVGLGSEDLLKGDDVPLSGAFHGDPELRQFLLERLMATAERGALRESRFPYWTDGVGTVSAALVRSAEPLIFEHVTGLPSGLASAIEVTGMTHRDDIERLASLLPAGADLRAVPARLMIGWLSDDTWAWTEFLSAEFNALRLDWLRACAQLAGGSVVAASDWQQLSERANGLARSGVGSQVDEHFAKMVALVSPLPGGSEQRWGTAFLLLGTYLVITSAQRVDGWVAVDFAFEVVRLRWFESRFPDPGSMSDEAMAAARQQFAAEHADFLSAYVPKEEAFFNNFEAKVRPWKDRLKQQLWTALAASVGAGS